MTKLRNVAIVAFAMDPIVARDRHRIANEMLYPQVRSVLDQCGVDRDGIDYQCGGSTDYIDGRPFGFVAALDVMGAWPAREDLHVEMDAAWAAYYAWVRMQADECNSALVCGWGKVSEGDPDRVFNLQLDPYYHAPLGLDPTSTAALQASAYMARSGVQDRDLAQIAARNRAAGVKNPNAQVRESVTAGDLMRTPFKVDPLRTGYLPPIGETAVALVLAAEGTAEKMCDKPVWIHGVDHRSEMQTLGARDITKSASAQLATDKALAMAGLKQAGEVDLIELTATNPIEELILREAMHLEARSGGLVVNPSGGPLCGHPVLMTGLIRMGEVFRQLAGRAGEATVPGARRAIAHAAQGHCLQQNLTWVLGTERRWA